MFCNENIPGRNRDCYGAGVFAAVFAVVEGGMDRSSFCDGTGTDTLLKDYGGIFSVLLPGCVYKWVLLWDTGCKDSCHDTGDRADIPDPFCVWNDFIYDA